VQMQEAQAPRRPQLQPITVSCASPYPKRLFPSVVTRGYLRSCTPAAGPPGPDAGNGSWRKVMAWPSLRGRRSSCCVVGPRRLYLCSQYGHDDCQRKPTRTVRQ
jgi:hypothetical protein